MKIECDGCGDRYEVVKVTDKNPYRYEMSGLQTVFLTGIDALACKRCKHRSPVIPKIVELHRQIAICLIRKGQPLRGQEIKYLRKWMGFTRKQMAKMLGLSEYTLQCDEVYGYNSKYVGAEKLLKTICMIDLVRERPGAISIGDIWSYLTVGKHHREPGRWELSYHPKTGCWVATTTTRR